MVNLWFLCFIYNLPGPPKITLDAGTFQLFTVNKRICPQFDPNRDTVFELYTRKNDVIPQMLKIGDEILVNSSNINFNHPTVMFFHGFLESSKSEDSVKIKTHYLQRGEYNVILVDSERLLAGPDYITAALNVEPIGIYAAQFVDFLVRQGLKLSSLHIIGMSLGAHCAGITGKNLISGKAARVTGLDPAGPTFNSASPDKILSQGDADFVDAIHTNAGGFGISKSVGDVDIWFNGGHIQPGCGITEVTKRKPGSLAELIFCSHYQAWRIYIKTLMNPQEYLAVRCQNHEAYIAGNCNANEKIYAGVHVNTTARGNYYIDTGVTAVDV